MRSGCGAYRCQEPTRDRGTFFPRKVREILFIVRTRLYQAELDPAVAEEAGLSRPLSPAQDPRKVRESILAALKRDHRDSDWPCTWQVCREQRQPSVLRCPQAVTGKFDLDETVFAIHQEPQVRSHRCRAPEPLTERARPSLQFRKAWEMCAERLLEFGGTGGWWPGPVGPGRRREPLEGTVVPLVVTDMARDKGFTEESVGTDTSLLLEHLFQERRRSRRREHLAITACPLIALGLLECARFDAQPTRHWIPFRVRGAACE